MFGKNGVVVSDASTEEGQSNFGERF